MRFKTLGQIDSDRVRSSEWHSWFAWRPVAFGGYWHWLETMERRLLSSYIYNEWEYRPAAPNKDKDK